MNDEKKKKMTIFHGKKMIILKNNFYQYLQYFKKIDIRRVTFVNYATKRHERTTNYAFIFYWWNDTRVIIAIFCTLLPPSNEVEGK